MFEQQINGAQEFTHNDGGLNQNLNLVSLSSDRSLARSAWDKGNTPAAGLVELQLVGDSNAGSGPILVADATKTPACVEQFRKLAGEVNAGFRTLNDHEVKEEKTKYDDLTKQKPGSVESVRTADTSTYPTTYYNSVKDDRGFDHGLAVHQHYMRTSSTDNWKMQYFELAGKLNNGLKVHANCDMYHKTGRIDITTPDGKTYEMTGIPVDKVGATLDKLQDIKPEDVQKLIEQQKNRQAG